MSIRELYDEGLDILGDGIGDFVPWLGIVGKVAGGALGGSDKKDEKKSDEKKSAPAAAVPQVDVAAQVRQVLDDERKRQQQEKLVANVRNMQVATVAVGLGVAGIAAWMILRK